MSPDPLSSIATPAQMGELGLASLDLPGIGGVIKQQPADFVVEEIPAYEPQGDGDHLYLWLEKTGWSHDQLMQHVAKTFALKPRDIGAAGMKDAHAITRQWISVPFTPDSEDKINGLNNDHCTLLGQGRHRNKLGTGHLRGNRFAILVRDVHPESVGRVQPIVQRLQETGIPNFYGPQRFGSKGDTAAMGRAILLGQEKEIPRKWLMHHNRRLALSALQSELFNTYLLKRWQNWGPKDIRLGDVMMKITGAVFRVDDLEAETPRWQSGEIVPTGPMFGAKFLLPSGEPAALEDEILSASELTRDHFKRFGKDLPGARRALMVPLHDFQWNMRDEGMFLTFWLPAGSYATVLLAEFMKPLR